MHFGTRIMTGVLIVLGMTTIASAADESRLVNTILEVDKEGKNHEAARAALKQLQAAGSSELVPILRGFKKANPLAANWLRSAFEVVADSSIEKGNSLPIEDLTKFIKDTDENPRARRLAYEWALKVAPELEDQLIPKMLYDPSPEFRRDAVQQLLDQATATEDKDQAKALFQQALSGAVDDDQVKAIVEPLKKMGVEVNLQKHFGFLTSWQIIGPFDNRESKGFDVAYPPESEINTDAKYEGQLGEVQWTQIKTDDNYGVVNIAKSIDNYKGSAMYLVTTFNSDTARDVQLRLGTPNAWKVWVNGELGFAREEYHRGTSLDQYRVPVSFKAGPNVILLKILQNEQTQDWAQRYQFQLRVSDASGSAVAPAGD